MNIFKNRICWREKKTFKSFGMHPASPQLEGKHSEPWHNIFGVLVDTIITPPHLRELVILCGDTIICMYAYWRFPYCWKHIFL